MRDWLDDETCTLPKEIWHGYHAFALYGGALTFKQFVRVQIANAISEVLQAGAGG
jgi:hypothetical protein